jgi:ubiquinone/menaquinone biosynthesis C-methylase UbiE
MWLSQRIFWKSYYEGIGIKLVAEYFPFESEQKFDYIHVSFCLEYVYDLFDALNSLKNILTENGLLFIAVPNCNSEYYSLDYNDTPRIHFFTKKSLTNLMEKYHFRVLQIQEYGLTHKEQYMRQSVPESNFDKKILEQANASIRENISREGGNCLRGLFYLRKV